MISPPCIAFGSLGTPELIAILFIVLLLFGAKKLPELARSLGQAKKEFSKASREVENEIEKIKEIPPSDPSKKA